MKHQAEQLGAKKYSYRGKSTDDRETLHFSWEIGSYNLSYLFGAKNTNTSSAEYKFAQLQAALTLFANFAEVPEKDVLFDIHHEYSYYDSVELKYVFRVNRLENDEEYTTREIKRKNEAVKAAETKKKNAVKKLEDEKKLLVELLKKHGVPK